MRHRGNFAESCCKSTCTCERQCGTVKELKFLLFERQMEETVTVSTEKSVRRLTWRESMSSWSAYWNIVLVKDVKVERKAEKRERWDRFFPVLQKLKMTTLDSCLPLLPWILLYCWNSSDSKWPNKLSRGGESNLCRYVFEEFWYSYYWYLRLSMKRCM